MTFTDEVSVDGIPSCRCVLPVVLALSFVRERGRLEVVCKRCGMPVRAFSVARNIDCPGFKAALANVLRFINMTK